jgi:hypothetical protein
MGYDIGWEVVGDRALSETEVSEVAKHVEQWSALIIGYDLYVAKVRQPAVQAMFSLRPTSDDPDEEDAGGYVPEVLDHVFTALGELKALLPAFEVRVEDDFNGYEWDGTGFESTGESGTLAHPDVDKTQWEFVAQRPRATQPTNHDLAELREVAYGSPSRELCERVSKHGAEQATLALALRLTREPATSSLLGSILVDIWMTPRPALWPILAVMGDAGVGAAIDALTRCQSEDAARALLAGGPRARTLGYLTLGSCAHYWGTDLERATADDPESVLAVVLARANRELLIDPKHQRLADALQELKTVVEKTPFCAELESEAETLMKQLVRKNLPSESVVHDGLLEIEHCFANAPSKLWEGNFIDDAMRPAIVEARELLLQRAMQVLGPEPGGSIVERPPIVPISTTDALLERAEREGYRGDSPWRGRYDDARQPDISRVIEFWLRGVEDTSINDNDATSFFQAFAAEPAMFDTVLAILRAPPTDIEGFNTRETFSALNMLRRAKSRIDDVAAVLIARLRRDTGAPWRDRLIDELADCESDAARAALLLELESGARMRSAHARSLARHPNALSLLRRMRDLPSAARDTLDEWHRIPAEKGEPERRAMLEHPYWLVRWRAAAACDYATRDGELAAVWRTLRGAETSLSGYGLEDLQRNTAEPTRELLPLPPATAGLASTCADHRRWAIKYVDDRRRESDAPALVLADELDEALAIRGYPRTRPHWALWRKAMPALPLDPAARGDWARKHEIEDATLRDVALQGAQNIAERFASPRLVLTPEERDGVERLVRAADERGRQLLRLP